MKLCLNHTERFVVLGGAVGQHGLWGGQGLEVQRSNPTLLTDQLEQLLVIPGHLTWVAFNPEIIISNLIQRFHAKLSEHEIVKSFEITANIMWLYEIINFCILQHFGNWPLIWLCLSQLSMKTQNNDGACLIHFSYFFLHLIFILSRLRFFNCY